MDDYLNMNLSYRVQQVIRESVKDYLKNPACLWSVSDVSQFTNRTSKWYAPQKE